MLQVNGFFCDAALPYLYDGAFLAQYNGDNDYDAKHKFGQLCQTILRQFPPEDVGPLLSAAFNVYPEPVETAASVVTGTTFNAKEGNGQTNNDKEFRMEPDKRAIQQRPCQQQNERSTTFPTSASSVLNKSYSTPFMDSSNTVSIITL